MINIFQFGFKKVICFLFFFFLPFYLFNQSVSSNNQLIWEDDFVSQNVDKWDFYEKSGSIYFSDGSIFLSAGHTTTFPIVIGKENIFPENKSFEIEVKIKYDKATSKGNGFSLATKVPPFHSPVDIPISSPDYSEYKFIQIWQDALNRLWIGYSGECYKTNECTLDKIKKFQSSEILLDSLIWKIKYEDSKYSIFLNDSLIFTSEETDIIPNNIWFGNNSLQGAGDEWTGFSVDHVKLWLINDQNYSKIIFIPGMMACWSSSLTTLETNDSWRLNSFFSNPYSKLTSFFTNSGLVENQDWMTWCYDWRRPVLENAEKLKTFLDINFPGEKFSFVGHSMGGLIAQAYTQNHPDSVIKTITLGSPHAGAVKAYAAWEGGQIWEDDKNFNLLSNFLLSIYDIKRKKVDNHRMQTIRAMLPSVKDLLPTFNFLQDKRTGVFKEISAHQQKNDTLNSLSASLPATKEKFVNLWGNNQQTLESIKIASLLPAANWSHYRLGLWEDGEPVSTCNDVYCIYGPQKNYSSSWQFGNQGDGVVLAKSAKMNEVENYEFNLGHGDLVVSEEAIGKIFETLGLSLTAGTETPKKWSRFAAFSVLSPAKITVTDPLGKQAGNSVTAEAIPDHFYDPEAKVIFIPDYLDGNYQIKVEGTEKGNYGLITGRVNAENDVEIKDYAFSTDTGKIDHFEMDLAELELANGQELPPLQSAINKLEAEEQGQKKQALIFLLKRVLDLNRLGKYAEALRYLKTAPAFLRQIYPAASEVGKYELVAENLREAYCAIAEAGSIDFNQKRLKNEVFWQEKTLLWKGMIAAKKSSLEKAIFVQKTAELIEDAQFSLDKNKLCRTEIINLETNFFLAAIN